ncbi:MAG: hypothetical protein PHU47_01470 [Candidatus ainarchaeum sp.]|nr:hypothetical protein [Candidatus ainarchaeum sp.]
MIEFSLSKMNLLIFVTAIASIVIFFMATVNSNMKTRQSFELVYKLGTEIKTGIESNSYCTVKQLNLPDKIYTNSGGSDMFSIKYKIDLSYYEITSDTNRIVLAIMDRRKNNNTIYAAYDIDFNGPVNFYSSDCQSNQSICKVTDETFVHYDPLKSNSIDNKIFFVKKIKDGKPNIYFFPCAYKNGIYTCNQGNEVRDMLLNDEGIDCLNTVTNLTINISSEAPTS